MRFGTALWVIRPNARQVETRRNGPGQRAFGIMAIDRHLTIAHFPGAARILARHTDRSRTFFEPVSSMTSTPSPSLGSCSICSMRCRLSACSSQTRAVSRYWRFCCVVPGTTCARVSQFFCRQQACQIAFETGKTTVESELETERCKKPGQFRQRFTRCLRQSFEFCHAAILLLLLS